MGKNKGRNLEKLKFFEGIVYVLLIITTIIANTYGNIYIKLVPLLFFLGIIGKVVYGRPVITALFGGTFSIVVMYINKPIWLVICTFIESSPTSKESIKNYIIAILIFILSSYVTLYMNGNIFKYKEAEYKLGEYLKSEYDQMSFEIEGYRYIPFIDRGYSFRVKNKQSENIYKFVVYEKDNAKIYDEFKEYVLNNNNSNINKFIANNINIEDVLVESNYYSYNQNKMTVVYTISNSEEYITKLANIIEEIMVKLKAYQKFSDIYEIEIVVKNQVGENIYTNSINMEDYIKNISNFYEHEYIIKLLTVEFFDF